MDLEPIISYPAIPRGVIKEEPLDEEECDEQLKQVTTTHPPIARGGIKMESQFIANQYEFNDGEQQVVLGFMLDL